MQAARTIILEGLVCEVQTWKYPLVGFYTMP
jgi:hypothetical protein